MALLIEESPRKRHFKGGVFDVKMSLNLLQDCHHYNNMFAMPCLVAPSMRLEEGDKGRDGGGWRAPQR